MVIVNSVEIYVLPTINIQLNFSDLTIICHLQVAQQLLMKLYPKAISIFRSNIKLFLIEHLFVNINIVEVSFNTKYLF